MFARSIALAGAIFAFSAVPAIAACSNSSAGFGQFKKDFARYAASQGIGKRGLRELASTKYSSGVIKFDRKVNAGFRRAAKKGNFGRYYAKKTRGLKGPTLRQLKRNKRLFDRIERDYGVQREVIAAIWGTETAFGGYTGKNDVLTSVASLAHDCRRSEWFRGHLLAALKIVDKGWMKRSQMKGARHGEIGQVQFMPTNYVKYAVDYDGNGRRDLVRSRADALASVANYLRRHGWQPMAGYGPGTKNFRVLKEWNASSAVQQTIAKFAASL